MKVIIVGAGVAGLAAANKLHQHGIETTILEGRDYIGGRIKTDHSFGIPIELGAGWLHGLIGNPIADIANELNLNYTESQFTNICFIDSTKQQISTDEVKAFRSGVFEEITNAAHDYAMQNADDMPLAEAIKHVLKRFSIKHQAILDWALYTLSLYTSADLTQLSAKHWDDESILPGGNFIVTGGYEAIVKYLSRSCPVELNNTVTKIVSTAQGIEIHTEKSLWHADAVIVTVPLGVLKNNRITFEPALPSNKQAAIRRLDMGVLDRVIMKFPNAFWQTDAHSIYFDYIANDRVRHFINYMPYSNLPILIGFTAASQARAMERMSDSEIVRNIMSDLSAYYGKQIPEPEQVHITRWGQDQFSDGAYSYLSVGACAEDIDNLSSPISNKIFFAGEATNKEYPATTHGAYFSGVREAERIIDIYM